MNTSRQIVRQLDILRTLQANRYGKTTAELAEIYGTTTRTIQRDLNDLKEAGFIVTTRRQEDGSTYHILEKDDLPPIHFPLFEIAALLFMEKTSEALEGTPFRRYLHDLIRRIRTQLPEKQTEFLARASQAYAPQVRGYKPINPRTWNIIDNLNQAILEGKLCRITYRSMESDEPKSYPIEPLRLLHYVEAGGLYLITRTPSRDEPYTLAVERIQDLEITRESFTISDELIATIDERLHNTFGIISGGDAEPFEVKIRFAPDQAPYIREREWHPSQRIEGLSDGGLIITFRAGSTFEIKRWVLRYGASAQLLEPKWLQQEIVAELRSSLDSYLPLSDAKNK